MLACISRAIRVSETQVLAVHGRVMSWVLVVEPSGLEKPMNVPVVIEEFMGVDGIEKVGIELRRRLRAIRGKKKLFWEVQTRFSMKKRR